MNNEYITREIKDTIAEACQYFSVIVITGPRQSGKTTLCKVMFSDFAYVNLEDLSLREQILIDPKHFLDSHPEGIVIDEAHHLPELFSYIQVAVDEHPERRYVITGSSNFNLLEKVTQSLAGRAALFTLLPLSLSEIGDKAAHLSTDTLMLDGGYPAVWSRKQPRRMVYSNYYATYVERDIRQIVNVTNLRAYQNFMRLVAGRVGTEFNASALSNAIGVTVKTIQSWLSVLHASYIAYALPPFYENVGKRLVKSPKVYFHDTGLLCHLLNIETEEQLAVHPLRGEIFENMVINNILKNFMNRGKTPQLFFYRDRSQHEVDLVVQTALGYKAYEIKSSSTFSKNYFDGITYLKSLLKERLSGSAVLYTGSDEVNAQENGIFNYRTPIQ
ncbi:MAG: ATP-binding protein, partial [Prevotellaceae bacterium]|nr:ATP-binding protein [Prevotellaceae bacterium]